jgi:hypothetical protein
MAWLSRRPNAPPVESVVARRTVGTPKNMNGASFRVLRKGCRVCAITAAPFGARYLGGALI